MGCQLGTSSALANSMTGFILVMITRESIYYINLRQAFLMSPGYASKLPSRTVLYTAVPGNFLNEARLRETLGSHVRRIWFPTQTKKLDELVEERTKAAFKLEAAETKLIRAANAERLKAIQTGTSEPEDVETAPTQNTADRWITPKQRPTHRLTMLIGKKVDTIYWCRSEIERLTPLIEAEQAKHQAGDAPKMKAAFVEFDTLSEAQAAYQSLTHHEVLCMAPRYTGMHPSEIIWSNLNIKGPERFMRIAITLSIVVALVIFWSIPVAVVGAISNINFLMTKLPWLSFLNSVPKVIFGVITGLLPVVALALLMSLLPPFLRCKCSYESNLSTVSSFDYRDGQTRWKPHARRR
jgi:calcium permeable stress-gated cation channel